MNKEQAKKNISKLVEKYKKLKSENKLKQYNEAQTRAEFIEPLFGLLGWDMKNWNNPNEVTTEENISNKRVDLAFRINGIPKFFLEAKPLKADLDVESYSRQAINYSWNKGVSWAVLTDFESLKLYNAQAKSKSLQDKLVFELPCEEFISDFDRLRLLSKESFRNNELDKYAEKYGKKVKKQTVNEKLYDDLRTAREILTKSFGAWNENIDKETLDEGVQRILDRLVFIRVLEDKKLEEPILQPLAREWHQKHFDKQLFPMMNEKFRELNDIYNSNLFMKHACEDWEEYDDAVRKVIDLLYGTDMFEYDFKQIPADILGGVYESYLGYIAQNPIEVETDKKSGKLLKVEDKKELKLKSRKKRKEQGIYYTPKYIVDYIVKETLGKKLDEIGSIHELKKLKVLDPACGSGSFLTKALETINDKYKDFSNPGNQDTKTQILLENIHGVDLDPQAVELAKLNLLIDALDKKDKLPDLTENVRVGNSLISGTEEELKKYFGKNWRDKKPFNWEEEFPGAMKQGGFDVIIGNPPYINAIQLGKVAGEDTKNFWRNKYETAKGTYDIYILFFEQSLRICREGGFVAFITPNKYLSSPYGEALRKFIIDNCQLVKVLDVSSVKVFGDPSVYPIITIIQKKKPDSTYNFQVEKAFSEDLNNNKISNVSSKILKTIPNNIWGVILSENIKIVENIFKKSSPLEEIAKVQATSTAAEADEYSKYINENQIGLPIINTGTIDRYHTTYSLVNFQNKGKQLKEPLLDTAKISEQRKKLYQSSKILIAKLALRIEGFLDGGSFASINTNCIHSPESGYPLEYLAAILNSKLISFVYSEIFSGLKMSGGYYQFQAPQLRILPIINGTSDQKREISLMAKKMVSLNKQLDSIPENSEKWKSVKKEIEKVDREIDDKVYELYGLTEEEIKIVEK